MATSRKGLPHKFKTIDFDKTFKARVGGEFKIIGTAPSINGHKCVIIKFLQTGTEKVVRFTEVDNGKEFSNVRDDYYPLVAGVGCIGTASSYDKHYNMWESMLTRCYDKNSPSYNRYGARGVTVCDRWHCFEYFLKDVVNLPNYDLWLKYGGKYYNIDKDFLQNGILTCNKVYSPETCMFLSSRDNIFLANGDGKVPYVGVIERTPIRYEAQIRIFNNTRSLGCYPTPELAAAAYNNALRFYYKNIYNFNNVPDMPPEELSKYRLTSAVPIKVIK